MVKGPEALGAAAWRAFLTAHTILVEAIERDLARAGLPPLGWYDVLFALEDVAVGRPRDGRRVLGPEPRRRRNAPLR